MSVGENINLFREKEGRIQKMEKYTWITGDHKINLYYYTYIYIYYIYYIINQTGILSSIPGQVAM